MTTMAINESALGMIEGLLRWKKESVLEAVLGWPTFNQVREAIAAGPHACLVLHWVTGCSFEKVVQEDGVIRMIEILETEEIELDHITMYAVTPYADGSYSFKCTSNRITVITIT
jgi:hypothetical protein